MIDIYVTHFVTSTLSAFNDILIDELIWLHRWTAGDYRITVVYFSTDEHAEADLIRRMPSFVTLVRNDRIGRADLQPSMRNKVVELARASGCEHFVLLHNDIRVSRNWLERLVGDLRNSEKRFGSGNVVISPRYVPYHWVEPASSARSDAVFWESLKTNVSVISPEQMVEWCRRYGFPGVEDGCVVSLPASLPPTDDGHQLMMFAASPSFFDTVGECDESFVGANYDDCDWGIRALQAGKRNMQSQSALIGHIQGLTFFNPGLAGDRRVSGELNAQVFIAKWGRPMFDEMQSGTLWRRLHAEQK